MQIYIDESGNFVRPTGHARYHCVGALTVPTGRKVDLDEVVRDFREHLGLRPGDELKGSKLDELQIALLIRLLAPLDVFFEAAVFDALLQDEAALRAHKLASAAGMVVNLTPQHALSMRARLEELKSELEGLSDQLYAQAALTTGLVHRVVSRGIVYYGQRSPGELATFAWQHDPKEGTEPLRRYGSYDRFFAAVVKPWVQDASMADPAPFLRGLDYSYFKPYLMELPEYLRDHLPANRLSNEPFVYDLRKLMADFSFPRSETSPGLQVVDVLTSAVRRTLNRTLQPQATLELPLLMVQPKRGQHVLMPSVLGGGPEMRLNDEYAGKFILHCDRYAKPMVLDPENDDGAGGPAQSRAA